MAYQIKLDGTTMDVFNIHRKGVSAASLALHGDVIVTSSGGDVNIDSPGSIFIGSNTGHDLTLDAPSAKLTLKVGTNPDLRIRSTHEWELGSPGDPGSSGQVITSNGAGAAPTWQTHSSTIVAPFYEEFVATAAQTVINTTMSTIAKGAGKASLQVFVNGVLQMEGATKKFTVTGANQITFNAGLALSDDVAIFGYAV